MTTVKQHLRPGDEVVIEIDRTGASGDYIAYPVKLNNKDLTHCDGIHLTHGEIGLRAKVIITSVDDGYPAAKIVRRYPSQTSDTTTSSASPRSPGVKSGSTNVPSIDIDPTQFGLDQSLVEAQQHPSFSRQAASPDNRAKQLRGVLMDSWRY